MFGTRLFTFITAALAGSTIVSAVVAGPNVARAPGSGAVAAVDMAKRQDSSDAQITAVLTTLQSTLDPILSQITALGSSGNVTADAASPLLTSVSAALDTATTSLQALDLTGITLRSLAARQSGDELADLVAGIVNSLLHAVDTLVGDLSTIPLLSGLLAGIDASLSNLLGELELLVAGLLTLVANLLTNVAQLLRDLAFDLTLASLGF